MHSTILVGGLASLHRRPRFWLMAFGSLLLSLVIPLRVAWAVPVLPEEVTLMQPDGTSFRAMPFGDEWYSGYEYMNYTILLDRESGFWVYAEPSPDGRLVPSEARVGVDRPPEKLAPHLRDRAAIEHSESEGLAGLLPAPAAWAGVSGSQRVLVILTDFTPSTSLGTTDGQWSSAFFDNAPGAKSVKNYYEEASYGSFTLDPVVESYGTANDGIIAVTLGYKHPYPVSDNDKRKLVRDALIAADPYIDFGALDTNGSGGLDNTELHLMVIARGFEESYGGTANACTPNVWGHRWSLPTSLCANYCAPQLDGVWVAAYTYGGGYTEEGEWHEMKGGGPEECAGDTGQMATIGIMVHELGHDIDWPDLYDTDASSEGVGYWSVMGSGSWGRAGWGDAPGATPVLPDAFLKSYQSWLSPSEMTLPASGVAIPNSAENTTVYQLGGNPGGIDWDFGTSSGTGEYFLIENRQLVGFDAGLWRIDLAGNAKGCVVWHIDETRTSSNSANADETRKLVDVEEANGTQDLDAGTNRGDTGDPWPGTSGNIAFSSSSLPSSNWYDDSLSGISVVNISTAGTGCTVDFATIGPTWDGSTSSSWHVPSNWNVDRVPGSAESAVIPSGVPNWPNVDAAASVLGLAILDGAHLDALADVTLEVYGDWTEVGSGTFNGTAGTVVFQGSTGQDITTNAGSHFHDLQIGDGISNLMVTTVGNLDVDGNLVIQQGATLAAGSGLISVAGNWTDYGTTFAPGSSTVILDGTTQTIQRLRPSLLPRESFEGAFPPTSWSLFTLSGSAWQQGPPGGNGGSSAQTGTGFAWHDDTTGAQDAWLVSPQISIPADGATLSFWERNYYMPWVGYHRLLVSTGSCDPLDGAFNQVAQFQSDAGTWTERTQDLGTYAGQSVCLAFQYVGDYSAEWYIDDVRVNPAVSWDGDLEFYNLTVNAESAAFNGEVTVNNDLTINAGAMMDVGSYSIAAVDGTVTNSGALKQTKTVDGGNTVFLNIKDSTGTQDKYLGAEIDPGESSMGSTNVTVWGNQLCPGSSDGVLRCFDLDPAVPQAATVTFYYTEAERNGQANATMKVFHWSGASWIQEPGPYERGGSGDGQWVQAAGVDEYSLFGPWNGPPTAVDLGRLEAVPQSGGILLEWETVSEADTLGFNIYRSEAPDGPRTRLNADLIPGQAPGSPDGAIYSWLDMPVLPGVTYYYWLQDLDIYGQATWHGPVSGTSRRPGLWQLPTRRGVRPTWPNP